MNIIEIFKEISAICVVLATIAGGVAVVIKMLNRYSEEKEFRKKCDSYEAEIEKTNDRVQAAHDFAKDALDVMQSQTESKLQELRSEQEMIIYCMRAVLDGLHQLNCNGPVTEASEKLDEYLNAKAHGSYYERF